VSLVAECAEKRRPVVVIVVHQDHVKATREDQMPRDFGRVGREQWIADDRAARAHPRHQALELCTRGTSGTSSVEIQGIGSGTFGGAGPGSGFVGVIVSSC
jgi:hypothetical protein